MEVSSRTNEIALIDELGHTVGMLVSNPHAYSPSQNIGVHLRYPIPCSKQASLTTEWLKKNFEENVLTSVPRSVMFEEYRSFCREESIKPFNQAVFGKVVRACFPNLSTRRLGVRGQSRYHYSGLCVKLTSRYANKFHSVGERLNVQRTNNNPIQRRRDVGAHVTIDGTSPKSPEAFPHRGESPISNAPGNLNSISLVLPPYPSEDDVIVPPEWTTRQMAAFLDFHRSYNRRLLAYIISLDFDKTACHVRSFGSIVPDECTGMLQSALLCDVTAICDDIMYQEATAALLPDCLATLSTEFNVTVRKFAKTLLVWMGERCGPSVCREVTEARVDSAKNWSELVRRITTLCHVAKEARKTLTYPSIVTQLLHDIRNIAIKDIADQCAFAACDETGDVSKPYATRDCDEASNYVEKFCKLLQCQAGVEVYAFELEQIVEKHAGLKPDVTCHNAVVNISDYDVITDDTRRFIMKWAMYGSKILTEITLKSSESVGTFHLVMLLFGDYINHVISLKDERAKRIKRLRSVIKKGSTYFNRLWVSSSNQRPSQSSQHASQVIPFAVIAPRGHMQSNTDTSPRIEFITTPHHEHADTLRNVINVPIPKRGQHSSEDKTFKAKGEIFIVGPQTAAKNFYQNEPAVVVEPAFSSDTTGSFYLLSGHPGQPNTTRLLKQ